MVVARMRFSNTQDRIRAEHAALIETAHAKLIERKQAAQGTTPVFPEEWGPPIRQCWLRFYRDSEWTTTESKHSVEPPRSHLTVWEWKGFEATATFDAPLITRTGGINYETGKPEVYWSPKRPPGGFWEEVGPTTHRSTLWRRPLAEGRNND